MIRLASFLVPVVLTAQGDKPAQAARGETLFFQSSKGASCSTCHAMKGRGTAVGPDLTRIARIPPRAIVMAIRATRTQYVQTVKLKNDETFAGMRVAQDDKTAQYYDLSKTPPELRKLERGDIASTADNATWKHPPESAGYSSEELADIIAYIRWASYGDRSGVKPADVE